MTLQTLEYFIAVAQHRNFTQAARACHVTQPALSRAVHALEEELGCQLLVRTGRSVALTHEGEVCLIEAKRLLQQREELVARVREAEWQNRRPLRMGYVIASFLNTFLQQVGGSLPFGLETRYGSVGEIKRWLLDKKVDAILLPQPCTGDLAEAEWIQPQSEKSGLYAIVHKESTLYERRSLKMADLAEQGIVMWSKKDVPLLYSAHVRACRAAGFTPHIVGEAEKMGDMLVQVTLYNGVGLSSYSSSSGFQGDYHFIPVTDSPLHFGMVCAWRRDDTSSQLLRLKELLKGKGQERTITKNYGEAGRNV